MAEETRKSPFHQTVSDDRPNSLVLKVVISVLLLACVGIAIWGAQFRKNLGVDYQNFVVRAMFSVVDRYVEEHDGAWPANWEDLESMPPSGAWYEPLDYAKVREHVIVDFQANPAEVAYEPLSSFEAVRPVMPRYNFNIDPRVTKLLETLRKYYPRPEASQDPTQ